MPAPKLVIDTTWEVELPEDRITIHGGTKEEATEKAIELVTKYIRDNIKVRSLDFFKRE